MDTNTTTTAKPSFKDKARSAWSGLIGEDSNPIMKIAGIIAAFLIALIAFFGFFRFFNIVLSPLSYMLSIFYIIIGLALLAVEIAPTWFLSKYLLEWAPFLGTLIGRGLVYLYIGLLYVTGGAQAGVTSWTYLIIGIYLLVVAVANFVIGYIESRGTPMPNSNV
ncbi:hypothetical protein Pmar_PMAR002925 [Perkinsus marinus ATCC 50983]|uniref:COPI associated protein n=1 Tax=Perkinsus marinus (strain ATCC 50983 / TXsc) TaxID=423536 RepID=C5LQX0_PERM5|nr:hypothetical protein Pmar_PMAR002925 [Perkinsus marinus ATCC 50983]EER00855.1 hypothetical protein Pmar_PMAR002925 [Perkinsus marinus ATCC 50983]|eukprot:XP_002768137.1 hypothetical protein Pmar_PMAR002925 [Perkinsus marinus ATCC 50983]